MADTWTRVACCANRPDAEVQRSYLHSRGIEARVVAADIGGLAPHLGLTGGYDLAVREGDAAAAGQALAEVTAGQPDA